MDWFSDNLTWAALRDADALWVWLGIGLVLILAELMTGSLFLMWPGLAALIMALIAVLAPPMPLAGHLALFAALAVALAFLGRGVRHRLSAARISDRPLLNQRGAQLVGRRVVALSAFENGQGPVRLGDSQWAARLEGQRFDAVAEGAALVVKEVEGATLVVAPL